ncbi:hypothetical protein ACIP68_24060 [Streptomyces griseoviridis]|uniref:hypothetical protein n=1 Tax=Streptomyces griseoviridis TaxID=45398 RepID=UPI0033D00862
MTTPAPAVPPSGNTNSWANRTYQGMSHYVAYTAGRGVQLYTSARDATTGAVSWVAENRREILDTAVQSIPALGLALQSAGTARGDSAQGASSAYNWGVAMTGASGVYTVVAEGRRALSTNSDRPGSLPRFTLGAIEAAGAGMYAGLAGPNPTVQSIGAGMQAAGAFGQSVMNSWQQNAANTNNRLPVTAPTSSSVSATAPQLPPLSFDSTAVQRAAPPNNPVATYTNQNQPASYTTGQTTGQTSGQSSGHASGSNRGAYNTNQNLSNRGRGR